MKNRRNYYRILHVQPDAPEAVIRSSYRTMMQRLKMHPDLGGDHDSAALVNEAYAVLINPATRSDYDASLSISGQADRGSTTASGQYPVEQISLAPAEQATSRSVVDCSFCQTRHAAAIPVEPETVCSECASPLYPADGRSIGQYGQRAIERFEKHWPVRFFTSWPQPSHRKGQTQDMSLSGMRMLTAEAMTEGQIIKLTSQSVDAVARVANCRPVAGVEQWRIGLYFLTLRFHDPLGTFVSINV